MDKSYFKVDKRTSNGGTAVPVNEGESMTVNSALVIDGQEDLSNIIVFNGDGCVYGITLTGSPGYYDYVVNVDAKGPKGAFSGSGHLRFTDESNDYYDLSIYSSTRSTHTVRYNSDRPKIKKVEWWF